MIETRPKRRPRRHHRGRLLQPARGERPILGRWLHGGGFAYVAATLIGIPVYVCDGGEIPLTRALLDMGVGPGPAFCFMLASVGTCIPTISMAFRIIGRSATLAYLGAWLVLAIGGGVLLDALH